MPIALPGSIIVASIAAETKAALDPNPPLLTPAKTVEQGATKKNSVVKYIASTYIEKLKLSSV